MKKTLLVLSLLLAALLAGAQNIESQFVQTKTLKASGKKIVSEGTFSFTAPDQLAMLYSKPDGDYFIIDGPLVRTMTKGTEVNLDTSKNPQAGKLRATLLNCIVGKMEQVAADNDGELSVTEKGGVKTATVTARQNLPKGYSKVSAQYRKDGVCTLLVLEEFGGIVTEYKLKDIQVK